jgi:hypothetical protein
VVVPLLRDSANLRLSRALLFEHGHGTGCREQALKVLSSDFNVYNIRATTTTRWHNTHANLDPTNYTCQPSLSSEAMHPSRYAPACFFIACLYPSSLTPASPRRSWSTV